MKKIAIVLRYPNPFYVDHDACPECYGKTTKERIDCYKCNGLGYCSCCDEECTRCDGTGVSNDFCTFCDGIGTREAYEAKMHDEHIHNLIIDRYGYIPQSVKDWWNR